MPPNILLFMTDSMDGRVMRHLGHPAAHTPNMDRLAALGTSFSNAYCNSPQCAPSRASFWSGQYVHRVQAWNNPGGLPMDAPTFGTHLQDAGYGLHVFGKTDYRVGGHSLKARLTAWLRSANIKRPHNPRPQAVTVQPDTPRLHEKDWLQIDNTCQFLNNYSKDDPPYFCYPSTNVPHPPFRATPHYLDQVDPAAVTLPPYESDLHPVMDYMSVTKNTHGHFTDEEILAIRRHYFAMVAETDAMLGQVLDTLQATGHLHNTYIIFASDHGEMNMEHRQTLKNALYEASARVPLIVAGPGLQQGVISDELVSLIDLFPTLMDIAGLEHPEGLDGVSLLPLCRGEASDRPNYVFSEYHSNFSNTGIAMWRQGPWKYIRYAGYDPQLFNLDDDPEEITQPRPIPPPHRPGPRRPPRIPRRLRPRRHPGQSQRPPQLPNLAPNPHPRRDPRSPNQRPPGPLDPHRHPPPRNLAIRRSFVGAASLTRPSSAQPTSRDPARGEPRGGPSKGLP